MSTIDFDTSGTEITVDSFVDTFKFHLDAFRDIVVSKHRLGLLSPQEWWEQFSAFLDSQSEGYGSVEDED